MGRIQFRKVGRKMYSMVYLTKESETDYEVIYKFGPKDELSGRIMLKKKGDPTKDMPIELEPVKCEKPEFFFRRAAMRLAKYFINGGSYPENDFIATGF